MPRTHFTESFNYDRLAQNPEDLAAVEQLLDCTHHTAVPILNPERRKELLDGATIAFNGIAAITIQAGTQPGVMRLGGIFVPPADMPGPAFFNACIASNEVFLRSVYVPRRLFSLLVESGTVIMSAITESVQDNGTRVSMLHVPHALVDVAPVHQDYPADIYATDAASALFDSFASQTIDPNK